TLNPWTAGACDNGGFDFDGGTVSETVEYNYSHENDGPGYVGLAFSVSSNTWGLNTFRYNITENDLIFTTVASQANGSLMYALGTTAANPVYVYNNTVWNANAGQNFAGVGGTTVTAGIAITNNACPVSGSVIANNIAASTAYDGTNALVMFMNG